MGNVDVDLGLLEHRHDGFGQLLVIVIREGVDEINDPRSGHLGARSGGDRVAMPGECMTCVAIWADTR